MSDPTKQWHLGGMNDALFIVDVKPRPSTDYLPSDAPGGAEFAVCVHGMPDDRIRQIIDQHNVTALQLAIANEREKRFVKSLLEILSLCKIGDVDETTEAYGWGDTIKEIKAELARAGYDPEAIPS